MKIINFRKKKMELLTKEQQESYKKAICHICKENFEKEYLKDKKYRKARDHCHYTGEYRGALHSIYKLK